jgi:hypothetical protein
MSFVWLATGTKAVIGVPSREELYLLLKIPGDDALTDSSDL